MHASRAVTLPSIHGPLGSDLFIALDDLQLRLSEEAASAAELRAELGREREARRVAERRAEQAEARTADALLQRDQVESHSRQLNERLEARHPASPSAHVHGN